MNTTVEAIPEEELGIEHDRTIDTAVEAAHAKVQLKNMAVTLDSLADSRDLEPTYVAKLRELQNDVNDLAAIFEDMEDVQNGRAKKIRERLNDE